VFTDYMNLYVFYCTMHCSNPAFGCQILINFLSCLLVLMLQSELACVDCSAGIGPELVVGLQDAEQLVAPDKLVLNCRISRGDPAAVIQWYRNTR